MNAYASRNSKMNSALSSTMSNASVSPTPEVKIRTLDDGAVRVQVGEYVGTVTSLHLVELKIKQLMSYWTSKNNLSDINQGPEG